MSEHQQEFNRVFRQAHGNSDGDVALLEEAARIADRHGDVALGLKARIKLIQAANWSGNHELVLVAFTWCLAQLDRDEQTRSLSQRSVFWYYKWVVESMSDYAQVSRIQIERSFADMTDRYERAGYGMGAIHKCKAYVSILLGDMEAHRAARSRWENSPRDTLSDCAACQVDSAVDFDLEAGDLDLAVKTAEPVIEGRLRCAEVPCLTFGRLLLPLLKLGRRDVAENFQRRTIRQVLSTRDLLATAGDHCAFLALTGKLPNAIRVFETGMSWMMTMKRTRERMLFLQNAVAMFETLAHAGHQPIQLKLPRAVPFYTDDDTYQPETVAVALRQMHGELVDEFNRRNGNSYMSGRYERFRNLVASIPSMSEGT